MNVFIVYAHPEPASFNGAMKDTAVEVLTKAGHAVRVSDLVAMEFKAVSDARDFPQPANPERLVVPAEQRAALANGSTSPDIAAEHAKVAWADHIIFQFPMWYYGFPAMSPLSNQRGGSWAKPSLRTRSNQPFRMAGRP